MGVLFPTTRAFVNTPTDTPPSPPFARAFGLRLTSLSPVEARSFPAAPLQHAAFGVAGDDGDDGDDDDDGGKVERGEGDDVEEGKTPALLLLLLLLKLI